MRILVIGGGGREHALAWKLSQSTLVSKVYASPGNAGIAQVAECVSSPDAVEADLTVVGPEVPLVEGIVDRFRAAGKLIVGPTAEAARLEGSKVHSKRFFKRLGIPTADFLVAENRSEAKSALDRFKFPVVLKADGLAAGKGVIIAHDRAEADGAITALEALGGRLVIEEFLVGEEVSFIVLSDGKNVVPLAPSQDHKAVFDGDTGPNTGGMGAYCDSRILTARETEHILDTVIRPTVEAIRFTGFLYAGLMMTADGPKVLEFNVRLGDPETQPLLHRLDCDLAPVLMAAAQGDLGGVRLAWKTGPSVCVVAASRGYPGAYPAGFPIHGLDEAEGTGAVVFHSGTRKSANGIETAGGRVLGVTAGGADLPAAIAAAYAGVSKIHFEGMHVRKDIGQKGIKRYNKGAGT
ncbi:MAG: phosphoribosylamine--glycine ligase [Bryobacterales bacterium]|nr:phosphoribosylamine--glycine ligase [Bryobacterales bacterium]